MSLQTTSYTGALGTIRAHDQAALDQFLLFAEQERQRLEANIIEAEMRCREADAALAEVSLENRRVAQELYEVWRELQAERDRAEQIVSQRLSEVTAEAEELATWSRHRPPGATLPYGLNRGVSAAPQRSLGAASAEPAPEAPLTPDAFFGGPRPADAPRDLDRREPVPLLRRDRIPPTPVPVAAHPTPSRADGPGTDDFWAPAHEAGVLRLEQFDGMRAAALPLLGVLLLLLTVLVWVG